MAIWELDLFLVKHGDTTPVLARDDWNLPPLPKELLDTTRDYLEYAIGKPWSFAEDWLIFGADTGNRVDVFADASGSGEIHARIDARGNAEEFAVLLSDLAFKTGCLFFVPESKAYVEASPRALLTALQSSNAAAFCAAPTEYLSKMENAG